MNQIAHKLAGIGHWLVMGMAALAYGLHKIQPLTPDMMNTIQMAMLMVGGTTITAILHNAWIQKALIAANAIQKGAQTVADAAGNVAAIGAQVQGAVTPAGVSNKS